MLYRWIISSCIDQGRNPPAFVRRRMERDPALRTYAARIAGVDDRLRHERPEPVAGRPVEFHGVPFDRPERGIVGRISLAPWGVPAGAAVAAMVLLGVVVAIAVRSEAPKAEPEPAFTLVGELRDLRADAGLLGRRIMDQLPKRPDFPSLDLPAGDGGDSAG